jgi:hypothetical protein
MLKVWKQRLSSTNTGCGSQITNASLGKLITLWSWVPLERPQVMQPLGSFPAFYGTRRFITTFTRALHLYLSWARPIQSTILNPMSKRSILIFYIHIRLGLPSGLFPSGFLTNNLYKFLFSPIRATCPFHLIVSLTGCIHHLMKQFISHSTGSDQWQVLLHFEGLTDYNKWIRCVL